MTYENSDTKEILEEISSSLYSIQREVKDISSDANLLQDIQADIARIAR